MVFSSEPFGATPASLTYTVPSQAGRTHLLANQDGPVTVSVQTNGSETTVTVTPGGDTQPNEAGVVEITE